MPAERAVTRKAISEKRHGGLNVGHVRRVVNPNACALLEPKDSTDDDDSGDEDDDVMFSLTETTHVLSPM